MIALAIGCSLVISLLTGTLILYGTQEMWHMDSPNAHAWNATFNTTATFGINIIPLIILIIGAAIIGLYTFANRGF